MKKHTKYFLILVAAWLILSATEVIGHLLPGFLLIGGIIYWIDSEYRFRKHAGVET